MAQCVSGRSAALRASVAAWSHQVQLDVGLGTVHQVLAGDVHVELQRLDVDPADGLLRIGVGGIVEAIDGAICRQAGASLGVFVCPRSL
jgi:hypothetical protein